MHIGYREIQEELEYSEIMVLMGCFTDLEYGRLYGKSLYQLHIFIELFGEDFLASNSVIEYEVKLGNLHFIAFGVNYIHYLVESAVIHRALDDIYVPDTIQSHLDIHAALKTIENSYVIIVGIYNALRHFMKFLIQEHELLQILQLDVL
jgi:hypothetical protein